VAWRAMWRAIGSSRVFTPVARRLVRTDRWISRVSGGRLVSLGMAPSLLLTTVGRRSGQQRQNPLQYVSDDGDYIVVGSNWGQLVDPGWVHNLGARPQATVMVDGRELPVVAEETTGAERERLWRCFTEQWPGYAEYERTAGGRVLRIFRLTVSS
jgi:deazaflavin-dependent oxidoreductase (nitroreductase family)